MAELLECRGNIFSTEAEVITVTVNCEGVMGAGIALEAKLRWPRLFNVYAEACGAGNLRPGDLLMWSDPDAEPAHRVLCFPTKAGWRHPSTMAFLRAGLDRLVVSYQAWGVSSIAMPHLGCSHGGLHWSDVRPEIDTALSGCDDLRVELWEFDPAAHDPDFERLGALLQGRTDVDLGKALGIRRPQATALMAAMQDPSVTGLATLQSARGVGEKTLAGVYELLFRHPSDAHHQDSLF